MTRRAAPAQSRELVDGGAAGRKIRHHLRGDGGRIGRDAVRGDAMIAGEHQDVDAVEPRRVAGPASAPARPPAPPAGRGCRRLGQARPGGRCGRLGARVAGRQVPTGGAQSHRDCEIACRCAENIKRRQFPWPPRERLDRRCSDCGRFPDSPADAAPTDRRRPTYPGAPRVSPGRRHDRALWAPSIWRARDPPAGPRRRGVALGAARC